MNDVTKIILCSFPGILSGNYILLLQWRGKNAFYIKQKFLSSKLVPILDLDLTTNILLICSKFSSVYVRG